MPAASAKRAKKSTTAKTSGVSTKTKARRTSKTVGPASRPTRLDRSTVKGVRQTPKKTSKVTAKAAKAAKTTKAASAKSKAKAPQKAASRVAKSGAKAKVAKSPAKAKAPLKGPARATKAQKRAPTKAPARAERVVKKAAPKPLDPKFLDEQRALLLEERSTYVEQAEDLKAEADSLVQEMEPGDVQFDEESGEGGTVTVDRERDLALSAQALAAVEEIDHALAKIASNIYGYCESCGDAIPRARLRALPYARLCVACKSGGLSRR